MQQTDRGRSLEEKICVFFRIKKRRFTNAKSHPQPTLARLLQVTFRPSFCQGLRDPSFCQGLRDEEFPEFSKKEISNPFMFQHNFEFGGGTLISLRSLALALTF
jgi:hypothetical protein